MTFDPNLEQPLREYAVRQLELSQANISHHKVGAVLVAQNSKGEHRIFTGCNIELATSKVWHAEEVALSKAISEGWRKPVRIYITSTNVTQRAAMCGYCMQHFMYSNPDCEIIVVDLDANILFETTVKERNGPYGYLGTGKLDP
jgi:cytidine deaminase